ncbi:hypothetical protein MGU_01466 [Metarhizium guizhouense ARSEF 977]|uniref:Myb-like domain-containing protein n=1 Tax=Metarhizium guizhouense (strain ARSEF 977) TaxID=1276136 RepID=A0A0B4HND3_METGA|nr:hypothetical protein MGU_01466 [Metarhizium guizhouense ARSEF 977]
MNVKNWNDRADKDLFFTILSVKNIGVISGAEWTTIGNHMRTLGYGFTNEGCRQHFQGLRRSQNKAEANGTAPELSRRVDPTLNPITRRPGPGRGRPRKPGTEAVSPVDGGIGPASASMPASTASAASASAAAAAAAAVHAVHAVHAAAAHAPSITLKQEDTADQQRAQQLQQQQYQHQQQHPLQQPLPQQQPQQPPIQSLQQPPPPPSPPQPLKSESVAETTPEFTTPPVEALATAPATETTDAADGTPVVEQDGDADADAPEEPPTKRQRLDTQELEQQQPLDDEAVLALAAHNGATESDYPEEDDKYVLQSHTVGCSY